MPHRSPAILGLLLAATLSVDAVAAYWLAASGQGDASVTLFFALASSQVSLVSVWAVMAGRRWWLRWPAPFLFALAMAIAAAALSDKPEEKQYYLAWTGVFEVQAAVVAVAAWVARQIRPSGAGRNNGGKPPWQFSLMAMIAVTAITALLLAVVRSATLIHKDWEVVVAFVANNVSLVVVAMIACSAAWLWPVRIAATFGMAILIGLVVDYFAKDSISWVALDLIQMIVLWLWLRLVLLIPRQTDVVAADETVQVERGTGTFCSEDSTK